MGLVLIGNLDDSRIAGLEARTSAHGRSPEAELKDLLTKAAACPRADVARELATVRAKTPHGARRLAEDLVQEGRDER